MTLNIIDKAFIILIIVFSIIIITIVFVLIFKNKYIKYVKENSELYKLIKELNTRYILKYNFFTNDTLRYQIPNKQKYNKIDLDYEIIYVIEESIETYKKIIEKVNFNQKLHDLYVSEYNYLYNNFFSKSSEKRRFNIIENDLCLTLFHKPKVDYKLKFIGIYITPKGRYTYKKSEDYNKKQIEVIINEIENCKSGEKLHKYHIEKERALMSASLRFKVLKRDNYKCKICGASERDGVKLHIDHIIPVSKGGKTEIQNLQVLCDRCNLGKSNRNM